MGLNNLLKYFSFLVLLLLGCVKDKPSPPDHSLLNTTNKKAILLNEGTYGLNNADISILDLTEGHIVNQVFKVANNKSLGDVAQHLTLINGQYWVALNNSNRISIIDTSSFKEIASINNIKFPRYILQTSPSRAYITSMYFPDIYIVNLQTYSIEGKIQLESLNPEQMLLHKGMVYCTTWDTASNLLYKIDPTLDAVVKKINLPGRASHSIVKDKENYLWILSGNKYKNTPSTLTRIDSKNDSITNYFTFSHDTDPIKLTINATQDTLYYINIDYLGASQNNGLYQMSIQASTLASAPFIHAAPNSYLWGLSINPTNGHIFITDPKGFNQQSVVLEYNSQGQMLRSYQAGIGASSILFP